MFASLNDIIDENQEKRSGMNACGTQLIEKCGFTYEGTLRDYFYIDGKYEGRMFFSILEDEYVRA
jgi:ribosomal-protein-alanine N-acetyltransferase